MATIRSWLFVIGGSPRKRTALPKEGRGFEAFKSELITASARTPVKIKAKVHPMIIAIPFADDSGSCHASLLMDVRANPTVTKEQMRYSDARVTLGIYGHVIGDSLRDAVDKVGRQRRMQAIMHRA